MRRASALFLLLLSIAALRFGWVWWERRQGDLRMARMLAARHGPVYPPPTRDTSPGVKITAFYAEAAEVVEGEPVTICYAVRNATALRIEPPVTEVWPSPNRCFADAPRHDTRYTLYARGGNGFEDSVSFEVRTRPAPPAVLFANATKGPVRRGEPVAFCYGLAHATAARLDPILPLAVSPNRCVQFYPRITEKYTLVVSGPGGEKRSEPFVIEVK